MSIRTEMSISELTMIKSRNRGTRRSIHSLPSMSVISSAQPDVIKLKVYKPNHNRINNGYEAGTSKKFCIDPRLASFRTIQCLIAQAFDIKTDFTIYAVQRCPMSGIKKSKPIWSDRELEQAINEVTSDSYLRLSYELIDRDDGLDDWDFIAVNDCATNIRWFNVDSRSVIASVKSTPEKKSSLLNKAINWMYGGHERYGLKPVDFGTFQRFTDCEGRLIDANGLRQAIYEGGIEPSCRKLIWCHLLSIFPINMTKSECEEYLKGIRKHYEVLKARWSDAEDSNEQIRITRRLIRTDVLRTDRKFSFYSTSSKATVNLELLYHILVTYCASHQNTAYCQGMSEYASALLYVMRDEAMAYICFCSIMRRLRANFSTDGLAIATKFHNLKLLLKTIDPVFWTFLEYCDATNLYFTYRWLLLECKREFPFNEALYVLEVMWATLPIASEPPALTEPVMSKPPSEEEIQDLRLNKVVRSLSRRVLSCPQFRTMDESNVQRHRFHTLSLNNDKINEDMWLTMTECQFITEENSERRLSDDNIRYNNWDLMSIKSRDRSFDNSFSLSEIPEFSSSQLSVCPDEHAPMDHSQTQYSPSVNWTERLSSDNTMLLDEENLFLLFLCISILLSHRDELLKQKRLDEQDISMYFDRYRRGHNADRLLRCARTLYKQYIQWTRKRRMILDLNSFSAS